MTTTAARPAEAPYVSAELYAEVQAFYARQMSLLDGSDIDPVAWSQTFTEDAVFGTNMQEEPDVGRAAILESLNGGLKHIHGQGPVDFRHWFGMVDVQEQPDGSLHTRYYALAMATPQGGSLKIRGHMLCRDELVRRDGRWLVSRRHLEADGLPA
ncbi:nuclear transport factor 2 family protein [Streptomyces cavernicola]|uniref:Nuclear transport factor 2 family protein n=1 Tax=Streptomyces cavernicola TaxID=3043613 RepID=A0ABT6SJ21_9ACTN|nr:nuclear transport factor 2 family protein [Streptomyces sp. B-S-A6]MDI3408185.1 nuclear transport factor 2 family protein [Streptomyces sp. B-S-A6]